MKKRIRRNTWPTLREEFVQRRLSGENLSLADFAAEKGIDRRTVERHSAAEGWVAEIGAINRAKIVARLRYLNVLRAGFRTR